MSTSKYFAFTLNNYTEQQVSVIKEWAKKSNIVKHIIFGYEEAPKTGTKHLQGAICLKTRTRSTTLKKIIGYKELHIEPCKKAYEANINYCKKTNNYWEYPGNFIRPKNETQRKRKQTYKEAIEYAKLGLWENIEPEYIIKYENKLKSIYCENKVCDRMFFHNKFGNFFKTFNVLLYGKTGGGKTYRVDLIVEAINEFWKQWCELKKMPFRRLEVYEKIQNKYWDGYLGEEIVIIEELDPKWVQTAGNNLKRWIDEKPFRVEIKGSSIDKIRPWFFILTSNYNLEELCSIGNENYNPKFLLEPLSRRIQQIEIFGTDDIIYWPSYDMLLTYFDKIKEVKWEFQENSKKYKSNLTNPNYLEHYEQLDDNTNYELQDPETEQEVIVDTPRPKRPLMEICDEPSTSNKKNKQAIDEL